MDARVIGVRKHAVLRTAMPAHDAECGSPAMHNPDSLFKQPISAEQRHRPYSLRRRVRREPLPFPLKDMRGWRAKWRYRCRSDPHSLRECGAPLGATDLRRPGLFAASSSFAMGRAFRAPSCQAGFPAGLPRAPTASLAGIGGLNGRRQPAPGGRLILAAGRSPGAARVVRERSRPPAGAAPGSITRRL